MSNVTLAAAATLVVTYGASSGGSCAPGDGASVTATPGSVTWTAQQRSTANPGLTSLASSPSISVTKAAQATLSLTSTSATYNGSAYSLSLATSGGSGTGALSFVVAAGTATGCAVSGSTLSATTSGTCLVTATQAADADYNATSSVQTTVTFAMASQSITWSAPGTQSVAVGGTFSLGSASDSSGSTVTFSSSTTGVCTVSGTTVTVVSFGTCTITPSAPASGQYLATTGTPSNITIAGKTSNGVSVTPSSSNYGNYGGQELLTFTSTSSITSMSVTINVSGTSGLFGCSQFNSYPTGAINESCASAGNGFTFTYTLVNGPIPAGYANGDVGAQWIGIGNAHSFANDTWTVTTTSGGVVSTLSGTFKGN